MFRRVVSCAVLCPVGRVAPALLCAATANTFRAVNLTPCRLESTGEAGAKAESAVAPGGEGPRSEGAENAPSTFVDSTHDDVNEDFDVEEAALQEIHDLTRALDYYYVNIRSKAYGAEEVNASVQLVDDCMKKLLRLLTPEITEKMILSANRQKQPTSFKEEEDLHSIHHRRSFAERTRWHPATSPYPKLMQHGPHELHSLRSDLPRQQIEFANSNRDKSTLDMMFRIIHHPIRDRLMITLENKLAESTKHIKPRRHH